MNQFKKQIVLCKSRYTIDVLMGNFGNKRHLIEHDTVDHLLTILKEFIQSRLATAIHCNVEDLHEV